MDRAQDRVRATLVREARADLDVALDRWIWALETARQHPGDARSTEFVALERRRFDRAVEAYRAALWDGASVPLMTEAALVDARARDRRARRKERR